MEVTLLRISGNTRCKEIILHKRMMRSFFFPRNFMVIRYLACCLRVDFFLFSIPQKSSFLAKVVSWSTFHSLPECLLSLSKDIIYL